MKSLLFLLCMLVATPLVAAAAAPAVEVADSDRAAMDVAASLKEYLTLSDDQVEKLKPVVAKRVEGMDAALAKVEGADEPDVMGFVSDYGKVRKEFETGVQQQLTPDQLKLWSKFTTQLESDAAAAAGKGQLAKLKEPLSLTDEQVTKLAPAFATATAKKIDVLQKLGDGGKIGLRDKLKAKKAMGALNDELEKSMTAVVSPDQLSRYKAIQEEKKKARKG